MEVLNIWMVICNGTCHLLIIWIFLYDWRDYGGIITSVNIDQKEKFLSNGQNPSLSVMSAGHAMNVFVNVQLAAGDPFIAISYDYDAPIDEYGLLKQPKWGHLKDLHNAVKQCEPGLIAAGDPVVKHH